ELTLEQSLPLEPTAERTWAVGELHAVLAELVEYRFGAPIWVTGELRSLSKGPTGHRYFNLVEPGYEGDHAPATLSVTLFDSQRQRVNNKLVRSGNKVRIEEGMELRVRGQLGTWAPQSRIQLNMTDIDPAYTLGVISQQRERTLAVLSDEGLIGLNGSLPVPMPPTRIALVTSRNSAAAADVLHELRSSGVGFRVTCIDARTQGRDAEPTMIAALRTAELREVDLVLLVRGGGSSSDLAVFDSEALGRAIAALDVPVFTGIGHETDHSVADVVAHSAHKTPTAAAAAVVRAAEECHGRLSGLTASVTSAARGALARSGASLDARARATSVGARSHVGRERALLDIRLERVGASAPRALDAITERTDRLAARLVAAAKLGVDRRRAECDRLAGLVHAHDPARMMERGWSVSHGRDGKLLRSVNDVSPGDTIRTTMGGGVITSTVTEVHPGQQARRPGEERPREPGT
ncbi:MAG: exodeoxyribonuclease VII large subunit, partial [Microthrixaceae bacterium]